MQWIAALLMALGLSTPLAADAPELKGCVILIHGLARSDNSLELVQAVLERDGYHVVNADYSSTKDTIPVLAEQVIGASRAACAKITDAPPFALTHSMGGILLRWWAEQHPTAPWARVVMLAPPNQGSELVDAFAELTPFALINGPAGLQLGTDPASVPRNLGPVTLDLGVIAGNRSLNPAYSTILPGPDDGKVTVASTRVAGLRAHLVLPLTHTFLMNNPSVLAQSLHFFETGRFQEDLNFATAVEELIAE